MTKKNKILYAASTQSHLFRFHMPYIEAMRKDSEVLLMADGDQMDFPIRFDKHFFSIANLKSIFQIRKILKKESFDMIVAHTTLAAFLIRAATFFLKKRPYIKNVVHGYLFSDADRGMRKRVLLMCEKLMRSKTDEILVMNQEDLQIAQKYRLCRGKISFIYGMGLSDHLPSPQKDASIQEEFSLDNGDILCTFVGELSPRKNQIFLIEAVSKLRAEGYPLKLLLLGEGASREELEAEIEKCQLQNIVFLPGNREGAMPYLGITDIYLSASISEGLPFNLLEAMHCGLPILATDVKGQTDLLPKEQLVALGDTDAFCDALRKLCVKDKGIGTHSYQNLEKYRLSAVFDQNLALLSTELKND